MKMNVTETVIGAQLMLIPDEKTGEISDYSKIHFMNQGDPSRDQVGQIPSSLPINEEMYGRIKGLSYPCDLILAIETVSAARGKTQMRIVDIKKPSSKSAPTS